MEHNHSHDHPNAGTADQHSRRNNSNAQAGGISSQSPAQYAVVNHYGQHQQYAPAHHAGGQLQYYQQQQPNHMQHHHYYSSHETTANTQTTTAWQWVPVAIPPPPPPPPPLPPSTGPSIPSQLNQSPVDPTKRRKRRWGPLNEQQIVDEQPTKKVAAAAKMDNTCTAQRKVEKEEIDNSTDTAIDAINALSTLDSKWNVPQKKKRTKRKRRKRKKGNQSNNSDQTNLLDASEMHNVWIDVEDVVKIINPSRSMKQGTIESSGKNLDGSDIIEFPPLKSETKEEEKDLTAMDTSELKSYADVLSRALGGTSSRNPSSNDDGSEMDISDEDSSIDTPGAEIVHKSPPEHVSKETATDQSTAAKSKADEDDAKREKEKRALKLAELKAKAKLANAKLRMALQRKEAMGNTPKPATANVAVANTNGRSTPTYNASTHQTKRPWHAPSASNVSALRDISALRNIRTLTISNVSLTGEDKMVRFIDSVYDLSSEDEDSSQGEEEEDKKEEEDKPLSEALPETEVALPNDNESQKKKSHQSLKQQLQLAKLRLEIKRKEQLLLEKKRKMPVAAMTTATPSKLPLNDMTITTELSTVPEEDCKNDSEGKSISINDVSDVMVSSEEKRVKLGQLRQRQKELKQKNQVSNLKNLINRQRQLLRSQGQELAESSAQLEGIVHDIVTKQTLLDQSNKRLEEMTHRKKIMEGMMLRATQKLMTARKALGEHKQKSATT